MTNSELKHELEKARATIEKIAKHAALAAEALADLHGSERDDIFAGIGAAKHYLRCVSTLSDPTPV